MTLVQFSEITKKHGDMLILKNVNLEVFKKEILSIVGPNGSGKTTLLKIMSGIDNSYSGKVCWEGAEITEDREDFLRAKSTMVFQKTIVFNTTVYNNVAYSLRQKGHHGSELNRKVREALRTVDLQGFENRSAKKLSGGEQQRLSLARALALEPELLLLDEPTANLDPKNVSVIEDVITNFNHEHGATTIIATHNLFQVERLSSRVAVMMDGILTKPGLTEDILRSPNPAYSASFARFENVFQGEAESAGQGLVKVKLGNLQIEAVTGKTGEVTVFIRPEEIIVSNVFFASSVRNSFKGRITETSDLGSTVRLKVDVGVEFIAMLTKRSFLEMGLNIGTEVYLSFKASAVQIL